MTAVLVPVHNALPHVKRCLDSIRAGGAWTTLHVYDDASDEETADYLRGLRGVHYLRNEAPRGYAHHLNTFALWCLQEDEDVAVVLNSDTVLATTALQRMDWAIDRWTQGAAFAGPALSAAGSGQMSDLTLATMNQQDMGDPTDYLECVASMRSPTLSQQTIATVNGAAFAFDPEAWRFCGPFDERFGRGSAEEEEWMRRVNRLTRGERGLYVPSACVYHAKHASFGAVEGLDTKALWKRNRAEMLKKEAGESWPDVAMMGYPREWPEWRP